uniref:Lipase, hepatic b n=1 Tax=Sinocyclocheilus grahami TaxID=75366 RepID=A0A672L1B3_SINGR
MIMRVLRAFLLMSAVAASVRGDANLTGKTETPPVKTVLKSSFHLYHEGSVFEETCAVVPFRSETLHRCAYNRSDPLVLIIHGWTMNGRMEPWIFDLASALKVRLEWVNVLISDWRKLALQPYPVAAKNSRQVGRDVAALLKWLEEVAQLSMDDVHLIGYSLGAHVAGFAGSHFRGLRKVGRITGLDPAGPYFEGLPAFDRLSPDDAQFVDAVHTFTGSSIVPGMGIKQSVAHVDFYPNGGSFQPGCEMLDIYSNVFQYGLQGTAGQNMDTFDKINLIRSKDTQSATAPCVGAAHKTIGADVRKRKYITVLQKMYTYSFVLWHQESGALKSFSSLLAVASDLGRLRSVRLVWKGDLVWSSWMRRVRNILSWNSSDQDLEISVWRICIKSGESQENEILRCSFAGSCLEASWRHGSSSKHFSMLSRSSVHFISSFFTFFH